ncbi:non-ribosomal peptide synthetase [Streptomyces sp. NPDC005500]|uniref:non-ribosomal peptide synthetase n=1 Tax=Streptomyces sp. NPDC005500 TaxID=3155007 RepID=UPI0033A50CF9
MTITGTHPFSSPLPEAATMGVVELFEQAAERYGREPAVSQGTAFLTYRLLADHVGHLAEALSNRGLVPGDVVGVHGGSMMSVAAVLAVLKAGAVLLPLDPTLPRAQRERLLQLAGAQARVTPTAEVSAVHPTPAATRTLQSGAAYIQFTSGSTGKPKGIIARHTGLGHFVRWQRDTFAIAPGDRVGQLANWSFEVVIREILTPLISGATLFLPTERSMRGASVFSFARDHALTVLHVVPSLTRHWLADPTADLALPALRAAFFAGEPLTSELVRSWRGRVNPGATVVNLYGPTETTLAKCYHVVPSRSDDGLLPVGTALPGCDIAVFRPGTWTPCPHGETGEIVLRTPYRTAGYLHADEEATFPANPFCTDPADRVYRTADLGHIDPGGLLRIEGRIDDQIKVRGTRVALNPIERAIQTLPGVNHAAVADTPAPDGTTELTAFVLSSPHTPAPADTHIRRAVAASMPSAAVPKRIIRVDELPLLPGGKIDRATLRLYAGQYSSGRIPAPATSTHSEEPAPFLAHVLQVCGQVCPDTRIAPDDDLLDHGVDSLMTLEIAARLQDQLDFAVPLNVVFDCATPRQIADQLTVLAKEAP